MSHHGEAESPLPATDAPPLPRICERRQSCHQLSRVHPEPPSDLDDVVQRDVAPSALDLTEIRPVQPNHLGSLLLTQPKLMTPSHHPKIVMDNVVLVMALAVDVVSIDTAIHTGPINHHSGHPQLAT